MSRGKTSFKFENMWLKVEGFVDLVRGWWNGYHFVGSPSYVLACKLKALKGDLKYWNKHVFGDVAFKKKYSLSELLDLDLREGMQTLSPADSARRAEIKADIEYLASLEEISWRQKLKALYLKEGDNNIGFFHRLANSHRCTNTMRGVEVEGILYEDESAIQDQVVGFYKSMYQEAESWRPTIDGLEFANLDETNWTALEREFEKEEIIVALREAKGDKAPGPNGFTMAFFQKCWCVLEKDILALFADFHKECIFEKSLNATFLCLIPKKLSAVNIRDFCPISLLGSLYKLLSKVLAHRLRCVLDKLISNSQNSFVGGR
ncbi:uncharacterized protein LOC115992014 [Quercus lobata]|uniref:uncharacterized protein LOC115992014 n=1 Tax=Quercus lobata TaxID=97700 RepID=UPI0012479CB0|nr:uncharacterized protein LOC115992014 [Quercus lobata]